MMERQVAPADFTTVMTGTAQMMTDAIASAIDGGRAFAGDVASVLAVWLDRVEQRRHLAELDEHILSDIGVDRTRALDEAYKPFWQR